MEKQEFLDKLRVALNGKVAPSIVADTVNYYEDYINTEIRMGRSGEEVMTSLGDPRLIARTIVETKGGQPSGQGSFSEAGSGNGEVKRQYRRVPGWVWLVLTLIIVVLVLSTVFKLLSVFWPFIAVMAVVMFLVKLFRDWFN